MDPIHWNQFSMMQDAIKSRYCPRISATEQISKKVSNFNFSTVKFFIKVSLGAPAENSWCNMLPTNLEYFLQKRPQSEKPHNVVSPPAEAENISTFYRCDAAIP